MIPNNLYYQSNASKFCKELSKDNPCSICIEEFVEIEENKEMKNYEEMKNVVMLKCGHFFHFDCIKLCIERCPLCRKEIKESEVVLGIDSEKLTALIKKILKKKVSESLIMEERKMSKKRKFEEMEGEFRSPDTFASEKEYEEYLRIIYPQETKLQKQMEEDERLARSLSTQRS